MAISTSVMRPLYAPGTWEEYDAHDRMMREKQYEYELQYRELQMLQMMPQQGLLKVGNLGDIAARLEGSLGYVSQKPVTHPDDVRRRSTILLLKEEE